MPALARLLLASTFLQLAVEGALCSRLKDEDVSVTVRQTRSLLGGEDAGATGRAEVSRQLSSDQVAPELRASPHDLGADDFQAALGQISDDGKTMALVELYASWCPACQHFKPTFEKVAAFFNGADDSPEPAVYVARVDCAVEENHARVCSTFAELKGFPTMMFGLPSEVAAGKGKPIDTRSRSVEGIVAWVTKETGTDYAYDEAALYANSDKASKDEAPDTAATVDVSHFENDALFVSRVGAIPGRLQSAVDTQDVQSATLQGINHIITSPGLLAPPGARDALRGWVSLLSASHPVKMCRAGSTELAKRFEQVWPPGSEPSRSLSSFRVCGRDAASLPWHGCRGSLPHTRGFTCGVWSLLHSTAANLPEDGGTYWISAVRGYISHFFQCSDCSRHFTARIDKPDAALVTSRRDAVMWIWSVHNEVNARLARVEAEQGSGDPLFRKSLWPPPELCPACHGPAADQAAGVADWEEDAVYAFLLQFYNAPRAGRARGSMAELQERLLPSPASHREEGGRGEKLPLSQQFAAAPDPVTPGVHEKTAPPSTSITHDGLLSVASGCLGVVAVVVLAVRCQGAVTGGPHSRRGRVDSERSK